MGLETGTYIDSLVTTNPASTDGLAQADDHHVRTDHPSPG